MRWTAIFKDGSSVTSEDLIYRQIRDRLEDLDYLNASVGGHSFSLLWTEGTFIIGGAIFSPSLDKTTLTNVRPICFVTDKVDLAMFNGSSGQPDVIGLGLGFQGNDSTGKNVKTFIYIRSDGSFRVES